MAYYVDVHAHIIHEDFTGQETVIAEKCLEHNVQRVVVNGLNPSSNRRILDLCKEFPSLYKPALGIYPLDAGTNQVHPIVY
jgi:TatD DNase family protein